MNNNIEKRSEVKRWIMLILLGVVLGMFTRVFLYNIVHVEGRSMQPTLQSGDKLFLNKSKISLGIESFERGDMISFTPEWEDVGYLKRVVALEGDKLEIKDGYVFVNDEIINESYIKEGVYTEELNMVGEQIIPEGHVFVLGDNRLPGESLDSRDLGPIPYELIDGKITLQITPLDKFGRTKK